LPAEIAYKQKFDTAETAKPRLSPGLGGLLLPHAPNIARAGGCGGGDGSLPGVYYHLASYAAAGIEWRLSAAFCPNICSRFFGSFFRQLVCMRILRETFVYMVRARTYEILSSDFFVKLL